MNTLTYAATTVTLPDDMAWPDENTWRAVEQRTSYSITGALLVESALKQAGRAIELQSDAGSAWMARTTLLGLKAWAALPGIVMVLVLRGQTFNVIFDHAGGAIQAAPVVDYSDPADADFYVVSLKFIAMP